MKTWKRALALVLALVMALSLVALPSFAEGEEDSTGAMMACHTLRRTAMAARSPRTAWSCPRPSKRPVIASSC